MSASSFEERDRAMHLSICDLGDTLKKAILVGLTLSAALFGAVLVSGTSSADADNRPYADNSVMDPSTGQEVCSQGS
jgi:hypothetical protein